MQQMVQANSKAAEYRTLQDISNLTRALMGSGELRVLMGGWPKGPPSVSSKVRVVEQKFKRQWKDLVKLYRIRLC